MSQDISFVVLSSVNFLSTARQAPDAIPEKMANSENGMGSEEELLRKLTPPIAILDRQPGFIRKTLSVALRYDSVWPELMIAFCPNFTLLDWQYGTRFSLPFSDAHQI